MTLTIKNKNYNDKDEEEEYEHIIIKKIDNNKDDDVSNVCRFEYLSLRPFKLNLMFKFMFIQQV